jgi:5-methyltetrahydrofolate corrinoid/iron sulfur protein methyltransferase
MIIIGEKINATRKAIAAALEARNVEAIVQTAKEQATAGADYIDVNGGSPHPGQEAKNMAWLVELVQGCTEVPVCIDTADPEAAEVGLAMAHRKPILNSISLEKQRLEALLPVAAKRPCMVVALLMSDGGTPCGVDDRLASAEKLIGHLTAVGKKIDELIVDPCFLPVSADAASGRAVIDAIAAIRKRWPEIHIGGGCSNISFGLPKRRYVNFALLCQAIFHGMDTGLVDPCIPDILAMISAAEAVAGRDEFCMNYVTKMR